MPTVWFSLKRSLHCKSEPSDVHDPKSKKQLSTISIKRAGRSGCSRSIANLKDVIHGGSKRHLEKPPSCSPRSIGSSEFLNPITHEVILGNSRCELKISGFGADGGGGCGGSTFVGTLRPGTPGPGGYPTRKSPFLVSDKEGGFVHSTSNRLSLEADSNRRSSGSSSVTCYKCGEQFAKWEDAEAHHLSKHAVTELAEGDSSRKIVEIICRTSWVKSEKNKQCGRIEKVLKVHNMQKTLSRFEEYRESVKMRASKLQKKHPRCLADGNELLRFYGTSISCSLGLNSNSLCTSESCCVCRIIRNGFSMKEEVKGGNAIGIFTASTSGRALEYCVENDGEGGEVRKVLIVCRVIAGRVHRPLENVNEMVGQSGFDSLAGKLGVYSNIEELYLLNPSALLPCFVVICKP